MAAADNLHPAQFQHHQASQTPAMIPPTAAPSQSHPELTDGSSYNAAQLWSTTAALKSASTPTNAD